MAILDAQYHEALIQQIVQPDEDAQTILSSLGLGGLPSQEQVYSQIEEKLLLPCEKLPDHWLPTYQMYDVVMQILLRLNSSDIGNSPFLPFLYSPINPRLHLQACPLFAPV